MDKNKLNQDRHDKRKKTEIFVIANVVLLLAIVLIALFSVFKLMKWNKGQKVVLDPNASSSEYDVEVLDQVFFAAGVRSGRTQG